MTIRVDALTARSLSRRLRCPRLLLECVEDGSGIEGGVDAWTIGGVEGGVPIGSYNAM